MVEGGRLEIYCTGTRTGGSNPSLSAKKTRENKLPGKQAAWVSSYAKENLFHGSSLFPEIVV